MSQTTQSSNTVWHQATITRDHRKQQNQHDSFVLWFTGLSGAGKSTLAHAVEDHLFKQGCRTFVLDGDNVRHGLCGDLGFSDVDRVENIRRISEVSRLFVEAGNITLTAFISPFRGDRNKARNLIGSENFVEIFCQCSLAACEERDVKGLYKRARAGEIKAFTGISSPYEEPDSPEITVHTDKNSLEDCVEQVLAYLAKRFQLPPGK